MKRQALYSCLTCTPDARTDPDQRAGVCLACSYNCHANHDLVELYTKRSFRCDCGTARILAVRCRLDEQKLEANTANSYNQNFSGLYCTCHRPYPDPEDPVDDEMIQCVVCEDWYHCRHLGEATVVPSTVDFAEMVCADCMDRHDFLRHYARFGVTMPTKKAKKAATKTIAAKQQATDESLDVDIEVTEAENNIKETDSKDGGQFTDEINRCIQDILEINKSSGMGEDGEMASSTAVDEVLAPAAKKQKLNDATEKVTVAAVADDEVAAAIEEGPKACRKPRLPTGSDEETKFVKSATFWPDGWRSNLCDCDVCAQQMRRKRVEFLLDAEDTVRSYEEKGLAKVTENGSDDADVQPEYIRAMSALQQLDHIAQIDVISGYNKLKDKLTAFLRGFATNGQVVEEADIKRFFRMMREDDEGGAGPAK